MPNKKQSQELDTLPAAGLTSFYHLPTVMLQMILWCLPLNHACQLLSSCRMLGGEGTQWKICAASREMFVCVHGHTPLRTRVLNWRHTLCTFGLCIFEPDPFDANFFDDVKMKMKELHTLCLKSLQQNSDLSFDSKLFKSLAAIAHKSHVDTVLLSSYQCSPEDILAAINCFRRLQILKLERMHTLPVLLVLPSTIRMLKIHECFGIQRLDTSNLQSLQILEIASCCALIEIHGLQKLQSLQILEIRLCRYFSITSLPLASLFTGCSRLEKVVVEYCPTQMVLFSGDWLKTLQELANTHNVEFDFTYTLNTHNVIQ